MLKRKFGGVVQMLYYEPKIILHTNTMAVADKKQRSLRPEL